MEQQTAQSATNEGFLIGEYLRQQRENLDIKLEYISSHTNIRVGQLRAIEEGNLNELPGMTYAVGFVRAYADFMGLDSDEVVKLFKQEHTELPEKPDLHLPVPQDEIKLPDMRILIAAAICAMAVIAGLFFLNDDTATEKEHVAIDVIQDVPEDIKVAQKARDDKNKALVAKAKRNEADVKAQLKSKAKVADTQEAVSTKLAITEKIMRDENMIAVTDDTTQLIATAPVEDTMAHSADALNVAIARKPQVKPRNVSSNVPSNKITPVVTDGSYGDADAARVILVAKEVSWIQIRNKQKKTIFKKLLRPGQRYHVPTEDGINLITTNAGGLDIIVDGEMTPSIGEHGEILRGLSLAPKELTRKRIRVRRNK